MDAPRLALISLHTSPQELPGAGDAGGMNVYVRSIGDELARRGWHVEALTRRTSPDQPESLRTPAGMFIRFLDAGEPSPVQKENLPAVTQRFGDSLAALPRFDLIHSHYWLSGSAALPIALEAGIPHILSLHTVAAQKNANLAPGQPAEPTARVESESELANRSQLVIASSLAESDALVRYYGVPRARVAIVAPGVDTSVFHPGAVREGSDRGERRPSLVVVGRIQPLKGQGLAIRALAELPPESRPLLRLIGGDSGPADSYGAELRALVREAGLEGSVEFTGPLPSTAVAAAMREADLVLVPSASETYGLVALEAAASGTPVVASRVPGLSESVVDGITGVFAEVGDPHSWGSTIAGLLGDPSRRGRLAGTAAAYGRRKSWTNTADLLEARYRQLLDRETSTTGRA